MTNENRNLLIGAGVVLALWLLWRKKQRDMAGAGGGGGGGSLGGGGGCGCGDLPDIPNCIGANGPIGNYAQGGGPFPPQNFTPYSTPGSTSDHGDSDFHLALDFDVDLDF